MLGISRGRVLELRLRPVVVVAVLPVSRSRGLERGEVKPRTHTASPKGYVSLCFDVAVHFFCSVKIEKQINGNSGIGQNRFGFRSFDGHCLTFVVLKLGWEFCCVWQLRRERIAERMKALQELVPNANKVNIS